MEYAGRLALELGLWQKSDLERQAALLDALKLPRAIPQNISSQDILELMLSDKKNRNGKITFVLPEKIGSVKTVSGIESNIILKVLGER